MSNDIVIGSIVKLRSGSARMTVSKIKGIYPDAIATCWRYENGGFCMADLPVPALKLDDNYCNTCQDYHTKLKWHDTVGLVPEKQQGFGGTGWHFTGGITA